MNENFVETKRNVLFCKSPLRVSLGIDGLTG